MTLFLPRKTGFSTRLPTAAILLLTFVLCGFSGPAVAKEVPAGVNNEALKSLARDFVARIGGKLKAHDRQVESEKTAQENPLSLIADGEILLLRPRAEKFVMDREIAAVKHEGQLYYALSEIISQLEFPIDYSDENKIGAGWFLREDWLIRFDFNKKEVVSRGETYAVGPKDIYEDGGQVFISQQAAQKWMAIETEPDIAQQYLNIRTPIPFPALARNYREKNEIGKAGRSQPELPRLKTGYDKFKLTTAEVQQSMRVRKRPDEKATINHQNVTSVQGDVLEHGFYGVGLWDNREGVSSIRARLSKEDEDPVLLGPLKAREYTLGDSELPNLPLTGGVTEELGFRVNNNPLRNADFQQTTISGDSLPGWDVELFRDGFLTDRVRVGDDARYEFQDIQLFAGDNLFEVFFYGPQGEIRSDSFNIPVTEEFLTTQDNTYDVSLTFSDAQLYNKTPSDDEDANTPHLVAKYNKVIGTTLAYAGIRTRQEDGEQKAYLGAGLTNVIGGVVLDANAAMDEKGASALEVGARKTIDNWRLSLLGNLRDEEFQSNDANQNVMSITGVATRNFLTPFNTYASFNATARHGINADDSTQSTASLGLSNQMGRLNLSNTLSYDQIRDVPGTEDMDATINNFLAARMSFGRVFARAGVNYNISPETKVDNYFTQVSYQPTRNLGGDVQVEHDPDANFTEGRLSVNYRHDKFRLTPFVEYDTNKEIEAGVRLTTALINEPQNTLPTFTGDRITGRGMVSSYVYHDKNGNNIFDGDDEPLPEVYVESVNITRRAPTDEKGYSLIKDLPENYLTDIRVDKSTLPDPFMIPGYAGASIYPRAGQIVKLTFPVHLAGEVDGAVEIADGDTRKEVPGMTVSLIPIDGKSSKIIDTFSAGDGFFVLSNVPPGNYLLNVSSEAAKRLKAGGATPIPVTINYDGTVLSGKNLTLEKGRVQVPLAIKPYKGPDHTVPFFALETGSSPKKSRLSALLSKLIENKTNIRADEGLAPLVVEGEENMKYLPGKDWQAHYDRCQLLNDERIPCKVILFIPEAKPKKATQVAQN